MYRIKNQKPNSDRINQAFLPKQKPLLKFKSFTFYYESRKDQRKQT